MEGRVAHHIVKPCLRLVAADVPAFDHGLRIEELCHTGGLCIQLTAIDVCFCGHEVEKISLAAGQVRHQVMAGQLQAGGDKLAQPGRREKLAVLDFLLCLAELMVIIIISPFQPVEAAVPRIGVVDVLMGDAVIFRPASGDQAEDFFI